MVQAVSQHTRSGPATINEIIDQRRRESMFTKASLVLMLALLVAILVNQRSQQVVQAQRPIEYKAVPTNFWVTPDGKGAAPGARHSKYVTTQGALDEYGKDGWQLVTHSYLPVGTNRGDPREQQLIFMRK
jgi:hypothetical protein